MMLKTQNDLREFHDFVGEKLNNGGADLTAEEVLDQWRELHPNPDELAESVGAVREALTDMANGDQGRPLETVLAELRSRHNLQSN
jgi:hypothetical protein